MRSLSPGVLSLLSLLSLLALCACEGPDTAYVYLRLDNAVGELTSQGDAGLRAGSFQMAVSAWHGDLDPAIPLRFYLQRVGYSTTDSGGYYYHDFGPNDITPFDTVTVSEPLPFEVEVGAPETVVTVEYSHLFERCSDAYIDRILVYYYVDIVDELDVAFLEVPTLFNSCL